MVTPGDVMLWAVAVVVVFFALVIIFTVIRDQFVRPARAARLQRSDGNVIRLDTKK